MNLEAEIGSSPITDRPTDVEVKMAGMVGVPLVANDTRNYNWAVYPERTIVKLMGTDAIATLARALADRTVDELAFTSISMM
jgi:hypothetical protein